MLIGSDSDSSTLTVTDPLRNREYLRIPQPLDIGQRNGMHGFRH